MKISKNVLKCFLFKAFHFITNIIAIVIGSSERKAKYKTSICFKALVYHILICFMSHFCQFCQFRSHQNSSYVFKELKSGSNIVFVLCRLHIKIACCSIDTYVYTVYSTYRHIYLHSTRRRNCDRDLRVVVLRYEFQIHNFNVIKMYHEFHFFVGAKKFATFRIRQFPNVLSLFLHT